jgi:hypothetical protein
MKIANIVYENELVNHTNVGYVNYYKGHTPYEKLDNTLPTLYVGWSFMKASNPDNEIIKNADILKKKIVANELYWECSYEESKASHIRGVDNFVNLAPNFYFQPKYNYINFDPIFFQIVDIQSLFDALPKKFDVLYNYRNEMIYLLLENKIFGVDLRMYDYFKFDTNDVIKGLSERSTIVHNDLDGMIFLNHYKIFPNFNLLRRYIITILPK